MKKLKILFWEKFQFEKTPTRMDFVNELLQVSGIRGHEFDLSANFIPLVIRSAVFVVCLMVTVRVIHAVEFWFINRCGSA